MTWNHRVVKFDQSEFNEEPWLTICEVFYNTQGKEQGHTAFGVVPGSETIEGLRWVLTKMLEALDKPILDEMK